MKADRRPAHSPQGPPPVPHISACARKFITKHKAKLCRKNVTAYLPVYHYPNPPLKIAYPLTIEHIQAKIVKLTRKTGQDDSYQGRHHGYHKAESVTHLPYVVLMSQKRFPAYHPL